MNLSDLDITQRFDARVLSNERITEPAADAEVRHLVLEIPAGDFFYMEGQSVGVVVPGPHEFGNRSHFRLYSIASPRLGEGGKRDRFSICVRRCYYIDDVSGERYPGKASNFLCDRRPGDHIVFTGPHGSKFTVPSDPESNLLMIGAGTGIAPFRAFVRHIYDECGGWKGKVRLFYGARTGTELVYMNDVKKDLGLYYTDATFQAFEAVSPRPHFDVPPSIDRLITDHSVEIWEMINDPKTYVYVAGLTQAAAKFDAAMAEMAGSDEAWREKREALIVADRLFELLYD